MNIFRRLVLFMLFSFAKNAFGQTVSNEGTDFWTVFPTHVANGNQGTTPTNHALIAVFVTSKFNTRATVSCGTYTETKDIPANTAVPFNISWVDSYINLSEANTNLTNRGIHIKVADDMPKVSAYAHIYAGNRSAASLILPFETLGQTYYSMNYTQINGGNNFLTLVAAEDNTTILLHEKSGTVMTITLAKAGDVYEYISGTSDLTGVYAEVDPGTSACKRFAAFSGSSFISIGCTGSYDPLYQQLYPTASWGRSYGIVPFIDRRYILRILAQENNTNVNLNGVSINLNKGTFYESPELTTSAFITSDKLISVAQYSLSQACSSTSRQTLFGDPDMVMLNPIEFNIKSVTVFSSNLQKIDVKYINVLMHANKTGTFKINGIVPTVTWTPLAGNTNYAYAQIQVRDESLTLIADEGFNAVAYGFGQTESYSYSAGTNLSSNNYLTVVNDAKKEENPNGCVGQIVDLKINLPYQPDKIIWVLDGGTSLVSNNPVPDIKTINGQTFYIYRYPASISYPTANPVNAPHELAVQAHVPNTATNCVNGDFTTNYIFSIYDLPTAKFTPVLKTCAKSDVSFTDESISNTTDFSVTNWFWDFGDGITSADQNPKHQYAAEGNYTVKLMVKAGSGCYSDVVNQDVQIYPLPVSNFSANSSTCVNTEVTFVDQSTISSSLSTNSIKNWHWDFGDHTTAVDNATNVSVKHQYNAVGKYTATLTTTSAHDCISEIFKQDIVVTDLPIVDFTMPDVCLNDVFATFKNTSVDVGGGNGTFNYEWNFGDDANATVLNPNITTTKDGKHHYSVAGVYRVTLKITNSNGCISIRSQEFTVNGAVQKAEFTVQNEGSLCSNQNVIINNTSTVFFGKVTKIVIYQDVINQPENSQTILYPTAADIPLTYDAFGGNTPKDISIKLVAYSGESCFKEYNKIIKLKPSPQLTFAAIPSTCQNDGSVLINQAAETSGMVGTGVYSGEGVDAEGNFNPKSVDVKTHEITYTFTGENGCTQSIKQTIEVYKSPMADTGNEIYILAGGQITLPATADGNNLSYQWMPALGLSNDKILNPIAAPEKDTEYTLTVTTNPEGCTATSTITVKVLQFLNPPNAFTPNGDNINDVWNIKYLDTYPNVTVEIFNRNGNRVFFSNGYKIPFDGNFQNQPLSTGVYYYIINPKNGRKTVSGSLTIIR